MKRALRRGIHFLQKRNTMQYAIGSMAALAIIVGATFVSGGHHAHAADSLTPQTIGLGQGTAACASSGSGPYCTGTPYQIAIQVNWDECAQGGGEPIDILIGDPNNNPSNGSYLGGSLYDQPCSGSATLTFGATSPDTYGIWIYGVNTGTFYDQTTASGEAFAFDGPGDNCAPAAEEPTGAITSIDNNTTYPSQCITQYGQTGCQPSVSWNTANTDGLVSIDIGGGKYPPNTGYSGLIPTDGTGQWAQLSGGTYRMVLWGQNTPAQWITLDEKDVIVSYPPPTNPAASCTNNTIAFSWDDGTAAGVTQYFPRIGNVSGACPLGWTKYTDGTTCYVGGVNSVDDGVPPAAYPGFCSGGRCTIYFSAPSTGTYTAWVHAGDGTTPLSLASAPTVSVTCAGTTPTNGACTQSAQCISNNCSGDVCQGTGSTPTGGSCAGNSDCVSDICSSGGVCQGTGSTPTGGSCAGDSDCVSGDTCSGNVCTNPAPSVVTFNVSPNRVRSGGSTTITWQCANATSASVTGQNGFSSSATYSNGSNSGNITSQTNFTLVCSNAAGSSPPITQTVFLLPSEIEQ